MAFEDRSSPNTATSPSSKTNTASSPESSRTTLKTTNNNIEIKTEGIDFNSHNKALKIIENKSPTFLRIASFAVRQCSTLTSDDEQSMDNHDIINDEESLSSFEIASNSNSTTTTTNNNNNNNNDNNNSNASNLMFSIQKILQPDFGKCAISKTKKDKISFKPYEDNGKNKINKPQIPPLGSLCQTVSLLGHSTQTVFNYKKVDNSITKKPLINDNPEKKTDDNSLLKTAEENKLPTVWPAWVYCTRYSDRPSSGPRSRRMKKNNETPEEKRPRTAFSSAQLARLKHEFAENRYLTEKRRQQLSNELGLNEAQIKIWFQNKRAKIKKSSGNKNPLALQLMAQGLYNHSTIPCDEDDMPLE